jgi:hypothetical protein
MPLCLQPTSERVQRVLWDPDDESQMDEAMARIARLHDLGFRATGGSLPEGELVLAPPPRAPDTGLMRIMSQNGDDRIVWSRRVAAEVREAYDKFKELLGKGYRAYAILSDGSRGHELYDFDPSIEECLLVPTGKLVPG